MLLGNVFLGFWNSTRDIRKCIDKGATVQPCLTGSLLTVGRHLVATYSKHHHLRHLDYGHRNADFLSRAGRLWIVVLEKNMRHSGFPTCKTLDSDFISIAAWPRLDSSEVTLGPLARAKRHAATPRLVSLGHIIASCLVNVVGACGAGPTPAQKAKEQPCRRPIPTSGDRGSGSSGLPVATGCSLSERLAELPPLYEYIGLGSENNRWHEAIFWRFVHSLSTYPSSIIIDIPSTPPADE